jgi:hypothetical protein
MRCARPSSGAGVVLATALCFLMACGQVVSTGGDAGSQFEDGGDGDADAADGGDADAGGDQDAGSDAGTGMDAAADGELTIINGSNFVITEVFVSEADDPDYDGPNLARAGGLPPDDTQTIVLACGLYDVLVIDEDGFECELIDLDVCGLEAIVVYEDDDCFVENERGPAGRVLIVASFDGTGRAPSGE